ncbi:MAG: hypothetical protein ACR2FN_00355 [Chitinophagaceae bacterium]
MSEDKAGQTHIWSEKNVEVNGRKYDRLSFVSAMIQKGFVGFYFMPVYINPKLKEKISAELLKCLKGNNCFHIKKNDAIIMQQIKQALDLGLKYYEENGWI